MLLDGLGDERLVRRRSPGRCRKMPRPQYAAAGFRIHTSFVAPSCARFSMNSLYSVICPGRMNVCGMKEKCSGPNF